MAKSPEEKTIDTFANASSVRWSYTDFARLMSDSDYWTQKAFYDSMISYITYKAVISDYSDVQPDRDSIAAVCQYLRDCLQDYFPQVASSMRSNSLL